MNGLFYFLIGFISPFIILKTVEYAKKKKTWARAGGRRLVLEQT
jgi:hypothetical protein